jgi:hypothetical protein
MGSAGKRLWERATTRIAIYATKYGGNIESLPTHVYDKRASLATRKVL